MRNILKSTEKEYERKAEQKLKLENEILTNLQECLLNDKAVESMANGIKKMREMSRKQVICLKRYDLAKHRFSPCGRWVHRVAVRETPSSFLRLVTLM